MPRTAIPITDVGYLGTIANLSFTAADATNGMMYANTGNVVLVVKNADTVAHNVTIVSVPDEHGRTGDKVVSVPASGFAFLGPFRPAIFNQRTTDLGKTYVNFDAATGMSIAALRITP